MAAKEILFETKVREKLLSGVDKLANDAKKVQRRKRPQS